MEPRQKTLRELKSLINYLRDMGAISIKVDNIECTFLPKDIEQAKPIVEAVQSVVQTTENATAVKDKDEVTEIPEDDPDLYLSATNE